MARRAANALPTGTLHVERAKDGSGFYWAGHWRFEGRHVKRRLGRAHVELRERRAEGVKGWQGWYRKRRGRPDPHTLSADDATVALREAIKTHAAEARKRAALGDVPTFEVAAQGWLHARRVEGGAKRKTLDDWESMLRAPEATPRKRGRDPRARLMSAFAGRTLDTITTRDVSTFLRELDAAGLSPRTVNKYRSLLSGVFQWAMRPDTFALDHNPVEGVPKRREADPAELQTYTVEHVQLIARIVREGRHRARGRSTAENVQDAAAILVAAFAGLRLGELLALRWQDVDFAAQRIRVMRSIVLRELTTPKSRKGRSLPMSDQLAVALDELSRRGHHVGPADHVFVGTDGGPIDGSALRRRYKRARDVARGEDGSVPELRWHDLRHTFGSLCAAAGVDVVSIQSWMGHSSIRTTQRYMHHAPSAGDAARLTAAFGATGPEAAPLAA